MNIKLLWREGNKEVEVDTGSSILHVLECAGILPSTVIVSFNDQILPHSTALQGDITLEVMTISSGG